MNTAGGAGRRPADWNNKRWNAGPSGARNLEGCPMYVLVEDRMRERMDEATAERLAALAPREPSMLRRAFRRRLGRAIITVGQAVEGARRKEQAPVC